jgi:hypothetical protein
MRPRPPDEDDNDAPRHRWRFRHVFLAGGSGVVLTALFLTDPDRGLSTALLLLGIVTPLIAVLFAHWARKALFDYPEADMRSLIREARGHPVGAGLALVAVAIVIAALLGLFGRAAHAAQGPAVPPAAHRWLPVLGAEITTHWPELPQREYLAGLIEHESCITLAHPRCWQPTARLRTAREEGGGLGQITRAWHADGSLRFDTLADLRQRHPALRDLDWATLYGRADLQLRALVLLSRDNWLALRAVTDAAQRLAMTDLAYNAGLGRVHRDRRACGLRAGCDAQRWWGHVEQHCTASRAPLYGQRSACEISRHHVRDVLLVRAPRYRGLV